MSERPKLLLIISDQQRGDCLSIGDHPALLTPIMDSIAGAGVRFFARQFHLPYVYSGEVICLRR